jgi:hypothetical protein
MNRPSLYPSIAQPWVGYALDRSLKREAIEINWSLDARHSALTPAQSKASHTLILCSGPSN